MKGPERALEVLCRDLLLRPHCKRLPRCVAGTGSPYTNRTTGDRYAPTLFRRMPTPWRPRVIRGEIRMEPRNPPAALNHLRDSPRFSQLVASPKTAHGSRRSRCVERLSRCFPILGCAAAPPRRPPGL